MTLLERLTSLAERARANKELLITEEATKNALIMPFLQALGYDVFNPAEVVPEFTADVGTKKGEKVDYAIRKGDDIVMLVEAKKAEEDLSTTHSSQLFRYFSVTSARLGILTNGHQYQFFSDLEAPNKMDSAPFLEFSLFDLKEGTIRQLERLSKPSFVLDEILSAATDLKYMNQVRRALESQLQDPDEEFVRYFYGKTNSSSRFVSSVKEQFTRIVRQAFLELVTDKVTHRLRSALQNEGAQRGPEDEVVVETEELNNPNNDVVTTEEELEGYRTVRAIVCSVIAADRITYRDGKSYFSVLVDDSNRKPVCRLHFNRSKKYVGVFREGKKEVRHAIDCVENLYKYADELRAAVAKYADIAKGATADEVPPNEEESSSVHSGHLKIAR